MEWNSQPGQSISYLGCLSCIISFCLNMCPWLVLYILHLQKHCVHLQFQAISSLMMCDTTPSILQHIPLSTHMSLWDADVGTGDEGTKTSLSQTIHYFGRGTWERRWRGDMDLDHWLHLNLSGQEGWTRWSQPFCNAAILSSLLKQDIKIHLGLVSYVQ